MKSPYHGKPVNKWSRITDRLIDKHPLKIEEIKKTVLKSWADIFNSKIGSFSIGKEIYPSSQIISFLLHELVAHYLTIKHQGLFKIGTEKHEKDIHCISDPALSVEIKGSSNPNQIFGNRSYAQPKSKTSTKSKDGFYITINYEIFKKNEPRPEILLIRFGYLEHNDWIAQNASTGQQARLSKDAYLYKLKTVYQKETKKVKEKVPEF